MNRVSNDSVGEVPFTPVCRTLLQYIAKIRKGILRRAPCWPSKISHCPHIS